MFFQATVRGRLEEDEEKRPVLILKAPQNVREYFDFKELPEETAERRGLQPDGARRVHPDRPQAHRHGHGRRRRASSSRTSRSSSPGDTALLEKEPVELRVLADQKLSGE